ncbi:MAG: tRNA (N(6)-L-threonylcarbamoyladenosine(37)-C(2))-methylthiotransferase MtaB, partial [Abditibacteriota bacterium]|nr:tRNA (N(6)-L-threonylcarbamoyladenosine(37)-C(2))-methylthiotransferase MtaB [Abditibacteriota bacterium]
MNNGLKASYVTLGCKVNRYETEAVRAKLEAAGFETVRPTEKADVCVVNTCAVTATAEAKSRAAVRKLISASPDALVVVCGCSAEINPQDLTDIKGVSLVLGNDKKPDIADIIIAKLGARDPLKVKPRLRTRAAVKVQDGCDNFCAYCIIPYARRGMTSRPIGEVMAEIESLAAAGYKEIVLTGIRLGSYDDSGVNTAGLVRKVCGVPGIERIRMSSIEPWEVTDGLIGAMKHPKVCRHLHIPLQSGSDSVLEQMNRPYTSAEFLSLAEKVRREIPEIGITTDIIVGFPGESEDDFADTLRTAEAAGFSRTHSFRYSIRKGTAAAEMTGQIPEGVKKERAARLNDLTDSLSLEFARKMTGKTYPVLIERFDAETGLARGFTDNYVEVYVETPPGTKTNRIIDVEIAEATAERVLGKAK